MDNIYSKLSSDAFFQNPYALYKELQTENPIIYVTELQAWIVTKYEDIIQGLNNPYLTADR